VLPHLAGLLDGIALRVPVADGSMTDLVATLRSSPSVEDVLGAFKEAATSGPLVGRLEYSDDDLVSTDIVGDPASCIFDSALTMTRGNVVKVLGWYDNEWGYANRLAELAAKVGSAQGR
jgi:glyceraldehyde 3-phosphate dehydrogenase